MEADQDKKKTDFKQGKLFGVSQKISFGSGIHNDCKVRVPGSIRMDMLLGKAAIIGGFGELPCFKIREVPGISCVIFESWDCLNLLTLGYSNDPWTLMLNFKQCVVSLHQMPQFLLLFTDFCLPV